MKRYYVMCFVVVLLLVLAMVSCTGKTGVTGSTGPAGPQQPGIYYVKNFQNGVYPAAYTGQIQSSIYVCTSGVTYTANTEPIWFGAIVSCPFRAIFKFDLSSLPSSKIIVDKAEFTFKTNSNAVGGGVTGVNVHKLTTFWNPARVSWLWTTNSTDWIEPGGDFASVTMTANAAAFDIGANDTITMELDPAVVQAWASNPSTNYGMILKVGNEFTTGEYVEIRPSGDTVPSNRPSLKVSYYTTD
jgi:hypothetical protein